MQRHVQTSSLTFILSKQQHVEAIVNRGPAVRWSSERVIKWAPCDHVDTQKKKSGQKVVFVFNREYCSLSFGHVLRLFMFSGLSMTLRKIQWYNHE